jgi:hypothetical protein
MSLLAACTVAPGRPPSPIPPVRAQREERPRRPAQPYRPIVPHPAHKPLPPPKPGQTAVAAPSSPALLAAPPQNGDLIGLDQHKAARLFGRATAKIEQSPATIWRYKTPDCELDLFFYLDLRSGQMRTLHYTFKGDVDDPEKRQDCLRAIVAARGG